MSNSIFERGQACKAEGQQGRQAGRPEAKNRMERTSEGSGRLVVSLAVAGRQAGRWEEEERRGQGEGEGVKERVVGVARSWESSSWGGPRAGQCRGSTRWACQSGALSKGGRRGRGDEKVRARTRSVAPAGTLATGDGANRGAGGEGLAGGLRRRHGAGARSSGRVNIPVIEGGRVEDQEESGDEWAAWCCERYFFPRGES